MLNKYRFWYLLAALLLMALTASGQVSRPNILMIYADDLGWGDVSFNGRKTWKTPHLDKLAEQGTRFSR